MSESCSKCGRPRATQRPLCAFCGTPYGDIAQPAYMQMDPAAAARARAEGPEKPVPLPPMDDKPFGFLSTRQRTGLLVLALPALVPGLVLTFIMAKRWGRVPFAMLAADAGILLLFCLPYPRLFPVVAISLAAAAVLYLSRMAQGRMPHGIVLGYSNLVALAIILGGALTALGGVFGLPRSVHRFLGQSGSTNVSALALAEGRVPLGKQVEVTSSQLLWERRLLWNGSSFHRPPASGTDTESWAPFMEGKGGAWLAVPGTMEEAPTVLEGQATSLAPSVERALEAASGIAPSAGFYVVHGGDAAAVARQPELVGATTSGGADWKFLWAIFPGLALLGIAVMRAHQEDSMGE